VFQEHHHEWLRTIHRNLFGYARALCSEAAEDVYQEALVRAMTAKSVPAEPAKFRIWMFQVLRNLWIDHLRARTRLQGYVTSDEIREEEARTYVDGEDAIVNRLAVREAFMQLSRDHREVLALVDIGGFSYEEAGVLLSIPRGTVMSRVSRARAALMDRLASDVVIPFPKRHKAVQ
jgi:RNA polymerase sigma-70 factor (ECF subfamily)